MDFSAGRVIASQQFERMSKGINHSFGIVAGGVVSVSANITVAISAVAARDYVINGAVQTTAYAGGTQALTTAHASLPRIDSIYIDTSGAVGKVDGTAAAVPKPPEINDTTQLLLANVYVAANDTTLAASDIEDKRQLITPKTFQYQPHLNTGTGTLSSGTSPFHLMSLGNASTAGASLLSWVAPSTFIGFRKAVARYWTVETGVARLSFSANWGAIGESKTNDSDTIAGADVNVTASVVGEYSLIDGLTNLAAGDSVGMAFSRDGNHANDTITTFYLTNYLFEYYG